VKKYTIIRFIVFLISSIIFISFSSYAVAESPQDDRNEAVSFLKITPTGIETYGNHTHIEKSAEHDISHTISVPVNRDLNAFFDFSKPNQEITKKSNTMEFRTVIGFHITLK